MSPLERFDSLAATMLRATGLDALPQPMQAERAALVAAESTGKAAATA